MTSADDPNGEMTAMSLSDEDQELVDLEEPVVDGPTPMTARDFVADSMDGQAQDSEWTVSGEPSVSGSGWTVELPDD
ncbi:hypothetical protein [Nocardia sp. NPDC058666]|uniref:hypothetical protein n=1 Tax=unclassified Nocardia TaxID=2637762 RepID=UPI00364655EB